MFIKNESYGVGDSTVLSRDLSTMRGTMLAGTRVTIINIGDRGYEVVDDEGNVVSEAGWTL